MTATIVDTCGDDDCGGCCSKNASSKYGDGKTLIDFEYHTASKFWGGSPPGMAGVEWKLA